jgi:hypothetical protein
MFRPATLETSFISFLIYLSSSARLLGKYLSIFRRTHRLDSGRLQKGSWFLNVAMQLCHNAAAFLG